MPTNRRPLDLLSAALRSLDQQLTHRYGLSQNVASMAEFSSAIQTHGCRPLQTGVVAWHEMEAVLEHAEFDDDFFNNLRSLPISAY